VSESLPLSDGLVVLRDWNADDAGWYAAAVRDPEIQRFTSEPGALTARQVRTAMLARVAYGMATATEYVKRPLDAYPLPVFERIREAATGSWGANGWLGPGRTHSRAAGVGWRTSCGTSPGTGRSLHGIPRPGAWSALVSAAPERSTPACSSPAMTCWPSWSR
jgi:hypothetical protein